MVADNLNITQVSATLASSGSQLLLNRNTARQYLMLQVTGTGNATFGFSSSPSASGLGVSLAGAAVAGGQGGSYEWVFTVPSNPVYAYSAAGTTVVAIEG